MQKSFKQLASILIMTVIIVSSVSCVQNITKQKTASTRDLSYKTYFDYAEEYDVLYFGTSHVMYGINPLEIWNDYGITSYNWGSPTCTIPSIYWKLMNVLEYATPELVVIDCFRASWEYKSYNCYRLHEAFDAFPLNLTKVQAIYDIMYNQKGMEDGEVYSKRDMLNILIPFSEYHSRWEYLEDIDFVNEYVDTKGCEFEINVETPIEISNTTDKMEITDDMQGVIYLKKIIEECQSRNIPILLTYLPFPTDETHKKESNMIQSIADEYCIQYINFTNLDVVNYLTDYADSSSHMNIAGQKKVSDFLGNYIVENFDINDKRNDILATKWNTWYDAYKYYTDDFLKAQTSLSNYLMLLYKSNNTIVIDLKDKSLIDNDVCYNLISNIGYGYSEINSNTDFIIVKDGQAVTLDNFRENGTIKESEIGKISIFYGDGVYGLYVCDEEYYLGNTEEEISIRISVSNENSLIDDVSFLYSIDEEGKISILKTNRNYVD